MRGLGTEGKRAASGRFAAGESDPQVGRETSRQAAAQPAKIEQPGKNPNVPNGVAVSILAMPPQAASYVVAVQNRFFDSL